MFIPLQTVPNTNPVLSIQDYSVWVSLGCSLEEQALPQQINVAAQFQFNAPPMGEKSDNLKDTLCYAKACALINQVAKSKPHHLIEHLAYQVLSALKKQFPEVRIQLKVHKLTPPIENLQGGVTYACGDVFL